MGLVVRRSRAQRAIQAGDEYRYHETLHRLRLSLRVTLHADRRGMGVGESKEPDRLFRGCRHYVDRSADRYAGIAEIRVREESRYMAVVALVVGGQVHG